MNAWDVETTLWSPWSPDGQKLVVARIDSKDVPRIPTIKWLKPFEEVAWVPTIACGGNLYQTQLYFVDIFTKKPVPIEQDTSEYYYYRVLTWLPDGSEVLFTRYNRVMSRVDIQAADAKTGKVRTLYTETSKTFVTHHHDSVWGARTGFTLLPDASGYLYISELSGWRQLYHYDIQGKLIKQLTNGEFPVEAVISVDQENGWVYFTASPDQTRPYDIHLCRISLKGLNFTQLTKGKGKHSIKMSPSNQFFVDTYSAVDIPPKTELRKSDGTLIQTLDEMDISKLEEIGWVSPKEVVVKAADEKTDLWVTMYFPYNFDSNKKYPLIEHIYAGPQTMWRPQDFGVAEVPDYMAGMMNFNRALANLGFIVIITDARGTPGRSKAFHDVVYNKFGGPAIADHTSAIKQLAEKFSYIDGNRVGIHGASWGGYHSFRAMVDAPEVYKVCISEYPGYDVHRFHLYEPYLGMPQDNKTAYDEADLFSKAAQLQGKLLMVGGINDTGTQADFFKMSEILIRLGKQHDTMIFPNTGHGAMGKSGQYQLEMKKNYFVEHLKPQDN
jgi:dipeptidyl aminopeptidase/acylaminoacyl peptidase